ncbi:maltose alpha-D-glucosyltransferase [Paraburkholderia lacunae]|uniref:maltose alpha-D-glucosyltransferase n=1 Tax=Paraburkholderia lacunae TaxID=2211104 RepID=UPI001FCB2357|nr:maltose alpha-D-glucosyltransferase [Paraburkholderia lacunae]
MATIGVQAVHPGPTKGAGGIKGRSYTPSVDGDFDRVSFQIDERPGTNAEFISMSRTAAAHNAIVIDDVVPAHTGKGADFRRAEMGYGDYPGLYHMVEIKPDDGHLLPDVPAGRDAINLTPELVDCLKDKCYIVGQLQRVIFFEPGIKETDWSVTGTVIGVGGVARRWVYLHYFKEGQPSLNWLDPTFSAQLLIIGYALHSLDVLGARGLRLDANGFLGVERRSYGNPWSESHPLSVTGNQLLGGAIWKAGGFSFQELNLTVDDIAVMSKGGADLSYDFITRPAYHHAILTGDIEFLRLMLRTVHQYGIDPASLIHALQNHDELTLELVHFWTLHANTTFVFQGQTWPGAILREHIRETMCERLCGEHAPYNLRFVTNGVACTTANVIAAALGIRELDAMTDEDKHRIQKIHLLLSMYNALQPGIFAISGWDLVGALPLPMASVEDWMGDGDTRWIQRGAYDLAGMHESAQYSQEGIPKAVCLYGPVTEQLENPDSFASQLKRVLTVRNAYCISSSRQIAIPEVSNPGLLVMVHELPGGRGTQVTALNFGPTSIDETLSLPGISAGPVVDMLNERVEDDLDEHGQLRLHLDGYEGLCLRIVSALPLDSHAGPLSSY